MTIAEYGGLALATAFGLGFSPILPGTLGALPGMALSLGILRLCLWKRIAAVLVLLALSLGICHWAYGFLAAGDATAIVADEYLTFPLAALALAGFRRPGVGLVALFVVSRVLDVLKPAPALLAESLPGAAGIVADDLIANLYAALLAVSLRRLWRWLRQR